MNTLLITGGMGFIGANFLEYWRRVRPDDKLVVLDALTYAANPATQARFDGDGHVELVQGSIANQALVEKLLRSKGIKTLVNFAAESHVDRSITGPDPFLETNIMGTHSLLKSALNVWSEHSLEGCRFHHISTDEVYGTLGPDEPPFVETSQYAPNSTYAASKASSDHLVRAYHKTHGLPVTTSNCSNNYGPLHFPEKLIPLAITNLLYGKNVPVYGDGLNIRDWLFVEDHCVGIHRILDKGRLGQTYNIGGNCERANIDVVKTLCASVDRALQSDYAYVERYPKAAVAQRGTSIELITYVDDRPGHDRRYAIDASKAERELGFGPRHNFDTGLEATVRWYLDNPQWWEPVVLADL